MYNDEIDIINKGIAVPNDLRMRTAMEVHDDQPDEHSYITSTSDNEEAPQKKIHLSPEEEAKRAEDAKQERERKRAQRKANADALKGYAPPVKIEWQQP